MHSVKKKTNPWTGALLKIISCLLFALVNTIVRYLSNYDKTNPIHFSQIVFLQNIIGLCLMGPWVFRALEYKKLQQKRHHLLRALFAVLGLSFWYASLSYMSITHAIALSFTNPIFTLIFARFLLQEHLTITRLSAIGISFLGAFFIMNPNLNMVSLKTVQLSALLPLASASFFAGTKITGRLLARNGASARLMTALLLLFMTPATLIPALYVWQSMDIVQLSLVLVLGIFSTLANITLAKSYAYAEISFLSPFGFSKLFFGACLGYVFFNEFPQHQLTWVGIVLILSSILLLSQEKKEVCS